MSRNEGGTDQEFIQEVTSSQGMDNRLDIFRQQMEALAENLDSQYGSQGSMGLLTLVLLPAKFTWNILISILKGFWKIPIRFTFISLIVFIFFYTPLTCIFEEIFRQNNPLLLDPFLGLDFVGLFTVVMEREQWVSILILLISTFPVHTGLRLVTHPISLIMYGIVNIICMIFIGFTMGFTGLGDIFTKDFSTLIDLSASGNLSFMFLSCLFNTTLAITLFWRQPAFLNPFKSHGLNALGEADGGFTSTVIGDNNLKNPVRYK